MYHLLIGSKSMDMSNSLLNQNLFKLLLFKLFGVCLWVPIKWQTFF